MVLFWRLTWMSWANSELALTRMAIANKQCFMAPPGNNRASFTTEPRRSAVISMARLGELNEGVQLLRSGPGIDRFGGERDGVAQVIGTVGGDQGSGGVENDYITPRRFVACQHFADQRRIHRGIPSGDFFERRSLQTKFFRRDFVGVHLALAHLSYSGRAGDRDLVQSVAAVDDQGAVQSQHAERFRQLLYQVGGVDPDNLASGTRRIGQRSEQV